MYIKNDLLFERILEIPSFTVGCARFRRKWNTEKPYFVLPATLFVRFPSHHKFPQRKILNMNVYRLLTNGRNTRHTVCYTQHTPLNCVTNNTRYTVRATIRLASRGWCGCHLSYSALWVGSRQELQKVLNNVFSKFQSCLECWTRSFPALDSNMRLVVWGKCQDNSGNRAAGFGFPAELPVLLWTGITLLPPSVG
jgi:hypothetical protein